MESEEDEECSESNDCDQNENFKRQNFKADDQYDDETDDE